MALKATARPALIGPTLLVLLSLVSATPALGRSYVYSEPLDRSSKFLRDRYEMPADQSSAELTKISWLFYLAGQREDAKRLRQFAERVVLYKLLGEPLDISGNIAAAIETETSETELTALRKRALDRLQAEPATRKTTLATKDADASGEAPPLWSETRDGDEVMYLQILVHNRGSVTVGEFEAVPWLSVPKASIAFECQQQDHAYRFAPGDSITVTCHAPRERVSSLFLQNGKSLDAGLLSANILEGLKRGGIDFGFHATGVSFPEHQVRLERKHIQFSGESAMQATANAEIDGSSCFHRRSCVQDILDIASHPAEYSETSVFGIPLLLILGVLILCASLYAIYRLLPRLAQGDKGSRRWVESRGRAGGGVTVGAIIGVILAAVFPGESSWLAIPVFALAGFAIASGPFLALLMLLLAPVQIGAALLLFSSGSKSGYDGFAPLVIFIISSGFVGLPVLGATIKLGTQVSKDRESATWLNWITLFLGATAIVLSIGGFLFMFTLS